MASVQEKIRVLTGTLFSIYIMIQKN